MSWTLQATYSSALKFDEADVQSYGGSQDANASFAVEDDGTTLHLQGNGWKKLDLPYTVTEDTVLEFDFRSSAEGEIHGIGFDSDNNISADTTFKLHGTQTWGRSDFDNYDGEAGQWQHYKIRVGDYFTGDFDQLVFVNDHDVSHPDGESLFRNVRVYEESAAVAPNSVGADWRSGCGTERCRYSRPAVRCSGSRRRYGTCVPGDDWSGCGCGYRYDFRRRDVPESSRMPPNPLSRARWTTEPEDRSID